MGFNFGAFAGGVSDGVDRGLSLVEKIDKFQNQKRIRDIIQQGIAEKRANEQVAEAGQASKVETGPAKAGEAYQDPETGATVSPVRTGTATGTELAPTANPDPAGAATASGTYAAPPSVSTQTPAAPADFGAKPDSVVQPAPAQAATPQGVAATTGVQAGKFYNGSNAYDTRAQAAKNAGGLSGPDHFAKNVVPRIQEEYLAQGNPEMAQKWGEYGNSQQGKAVMKDWQKMAMSPDFDALIGNAGQFYTKHINDGVDYKSHEIITKSDGSQVGVITLKDQKTGKETKMEMTQDQIMQMGYANNPQALFEHGMKQRDAAVKAGTEFKLKKMEKDADFNRDMAKQTMIEDRADKRDQRKNQNALSMLTLKDQLETANLGVKEKAAVDAKIEILRATGHTEEEIKGMVPILLKAGEYKKMTDPAERRAIIGTELMKSDPTFSRATPEEQRKRIDSAMSAIADSPKAAAPGKPASPAAPAVAISDKPVPYSKDLPVKWNKRDGKPYHLMPDGSYAPINVEVPGNAGAAPAPAPAKPAAPTPAAVAATGMPAAPAPAPAPAQPNTPTAPKPMSTLDKIEADNMAAVAPMAEQFKKAEQVYIAAARSGDQQAMAKYLEQKETLRKSLEQQVLDRFGNNAPRILKQLLGQ